MSFLVNMITTWFIVAIFVESILVNAAGIADSTGFLLTSTTGNNDQSPKLTDDQTEDLFDANGDSNDFFTDDYDFIQEEETNTGAQSGQKAYKKQPSAEKQMLFGDGEPFLTKDSVFDQGDSRQDLRMSIYGETRDFLQFLRQIQYDHRQCPENEGGPVDVEVSIVVSNIRAVSEVTMDYALELFYREVWVDNRLQYNITKFKNKTELTLHESYTNFLWHPDTFMPNAIASKNPQKQSISHRSLLRLGNNGNVLYSRRISIVAECPMDLTLFPFDTQVCKLGIESYGYTADQVRYNWSKVIDSLTLQKIRLPDFRIVEAYVTSHLESYATGDYSRLYVCFVFSRSSGFCFLQLIIPSTAVVITSWVSLWMESETEFQDMVSIILAITFLIFSYNEMMPRVSYIKAMDVYLGVCFMIVFFSLIKLAVFKYMREKLKGSNKGNDSQSFLPILRVETPGKPFNNSLKGDVPSVVISEQNNNTQNKSSELNNFTASASAPITFSLPTDDDVKPQKRTSVSYNVPMTTLNGTTSTDNGTVLFGGNNRHMSKFLPQWRVTHRNVRRSHYISQMIFMFFFITFVLFYFLFYPNLHFIPEDPACQKENAEWYAQII